jgi:hypothetical protein
MREVRNAYNILFLVGKLKGRAHLEDLGKDGEIILGYIQKCPD